MESALKLKAAICPIPPLSLLHCDYLLNYIVPAKCAWLKSSGRRQRILFAQSEAHIESDKLTSAVILASGRFAKLQHVFQNIHGQSSPRPVVVDFIAWSEQPRWHGSLHCVLIRYCSMTSAEAAHILTALVGRFDPLDPISHQIFPAYPCIRRTHSSWSVMCYRLQRSCRSKFLP